jgi:copper chaperone CopZ
VGKAALEGLKGIKKVEIGFKNSKEINIIQYDPTLISLEEMEKALQRARTYLGTAR